MLPNNAPDAHKTRRRKIFKRILLVCVLLAAVPSRSRRVGSRFFSFVEERADTTSQTFVRLTVLILVTLVAFSAVFDLDIVLGSFAAGFVFFAAGFLFCANTDTSQILYILLFYY